MRILIILLLMPLFVLALDKKNSNSLSPQTLLVDCPVNITVLEGQKYDTSVTGFPKVVSNDGGVVTTSYIEIFNKGNCSNGNDLLSRIFTIRNAVGDIERCTQVIYIKHLTPAQVRVPTDTLIEYPKDKSFAQAIIRLPSSLGSIDISYIDTKVSNMCTIPIRIKREWSIRDKCSSNVVKKTTNITLISYQNSFEHTKTVVTDLCSDEGEIYLTPKGEFGPYTYLWNTNATTASISNLTAGNYSVVITDAFKCPQLNTTTLTNMSQTGDVGGLISTEANYRVNPDSIYIADIGNISKFCNSSNGGIHYAFKVKSKKVGFAEYRFVKRTQVLDGVSTRDIVLIQKHVLGKRLLEDTLRYFAADVNSNFSVTSSDVVEIRKLILGIKDNFTNVLPWYFFRPDWKSVITKNNSYESIFYKGVNIISYPRLNADVLAVKMGDVDLSYNNTATTLGVRGKTLNGKVYISYSINQSKNEIEVPIFLHSSNTEVQGFQFSMDIPKNCELIDVQSGLLDPTYYNLKDNSLRVSYSTGSILDISENLPLLTLKFKMSNLSCLISDKLELSNSLENVFYFGEELSMHLLEMYSRNANYSKEYEILPNPAQSYFSVRGSSETSKAVIQIYQMDGKLIYQNSFSGKLDVNTSNWMPTLYYYLIKSSSDNPPQQGSIIIHP